MPRCKYCSQLYKPARTMQPGRVCNSIECQAKHAEEVIADRRKKTAKAERVAAAEDRKTVKIKLEQIKPRSQWMREAQAAFNAYRREVAKVNGYPCISSGKPLDWSGNNVDAGHYRSVGSAPHLRFVEDNCHAQSKHDNRYLSGNAVDYRIGLIARIGLAAVEALEADNEPRKYTIEELKAIKSTYIAKLKELRK